MKKTKDTSNPRVDNLERRLDLKCSFCPPNKGDNSKHKGKHGKGKAKYKSKRKGKV